MALPTGGDWPPKPWNISADKMREHDAWYVGDTKTLSGIYQGGQGNAPRTRPSQMSGGVVGAVARMFWGRPIPAGQARTRLHVPVAADLATTNADLLFSEPPRLVIDQGSSSADGKTRVKNPTQERLEALFNTPHVHSSLLEAAEVSAALGGVFPRLVWDADVAEHVMLDSVHADAAVPEFRFGRLVAVTFWTEIEREGQQVVRHLERHEPGVILHGVYAGTATDLGKPRPLANYEATQWAAPLVNGEGAIETGVKGLTAAYVPNMRPQREWRSQIGLRDLGRSDYDGLEATLDALDEAYSSWMRDVRLAKARILVGAGYLSSNGPGQGASFDDDQEIFTELNLPGSSSTAPVITPQQFSIRWEEHRQTCNELLKTILRGAGYSAATFGDDPMAISTTATEVKARERLSERTRDKKARYWAAALGPLAKTMLELDVAVFGSPVPVDAMPEVRFPSKTQQDPEELARTTQALRAAEAASTETMVRMLHPDWDGETVNAEVDKILAESGRAVPNPDQIA